MKRPANLKLGVSGDVTTRADVTWTTATRLMPNGRGPLIVGFAPPAGRATLRRLQRMAERGMRQQGQGQAPGGFDEMIGESHGAAIALAKPCRIEQDNQPFRPVMPNRAGAPLPPVSQPYRARPAPSRRLTACCGNRMLAVKVVADSYRHFSGVGFAGCPQGRLQGAGHFQADHDVAHYRDHQCHAHQSGESELLPGHGRERTRTAHASMNVAALMCGAVGIAAKFARLDPRRRPPPTRRKPIERLMKATG